MPNITLKGPNWPVNGTIYTQWGAFPVVDGVTSVPDAVASEWLRADRRLRVAGQPGGGSPVAAPEMGVEKLRLAPAPPPTAPIQESDLLTDDAPVAASEPPPQQPQEPATAAVPVEASLAPASEPEATQTPPPQPRARRARRSKQQ